MSTSRCAKQQVLGGCHELRRRKLEQGPAADPLQLERRVAILGGIALIAFGVILFRLWYLQVLSGDRYLAEAQGNRVREVTVQAPRGEILDRDGEVLVGNRTALALQVRKDELPEDGAERVKVLERRLRGRPG